MKKSMNKFHSKTVYPWSPIFWRVKSLYESSFPPIERISLVWMIWMALVGKADFLAYFDGDTFCGFSYSLHSTEAYYLFFLAVSEDLHSQGYGKKILAEVAEKAAGRPIFLVIEPLDEEQDNYENRLRRLAFYEKNGYHLTDYLYYENQEVYQVLTNQKEAEITHLEKVAVSIEQTGIRIRVANSKSNHEN